jgi:hypothetical protein
VGSSAAHAVRALSLIASGRISLLQHNVCFAATGPPADARFFDWVARRSPAPRPPGVKLTYLERGAYGTAIGIALVSVFVDAPINMLIVSVLRSIRNRGTFCIWCSVLAPSTA